MNIEQIAGVLAGHGFRKWGDRLTDENWVVCLCGETMEGAQKWQVLLAAHQAAVLAPLIVAAQAEALRTAAEIKFDGLHGEPLYAWLNARADFLMQTIEGNRA